ncbi:acetylglutamate kinase [Streptomyces flavidovirens]|uniref:acetylglutamate kinase n=1 Tax=Streptomyces flavidovirens TaxID=67298 RepID=UPI0004097DCD|nr:acetylglutamate kinase [Streptomyces flavidovirens]
MAQDLTQDLTGRGPNTLVGNSAPGGVIVVKIGGGSDPQAVLDEVAELAAAGRPVVLVHGGGAVADRLSGQLGVRRQVIQSPDGTHSRRTDEAMLDVITLALLGRVKPQLVSGLRARGARAVGLSGADGALLTATRKPALRSVQDGRTVLIRDDRSGRIEHVDPTPVRAVLDRGDVPVVSPPASDTAGNLLNVDADEAAARLAAALGASALVLLTDVCGVLADPDDPSTRIAEVGPHHLTGDVVRGRMRHKVRAGLRASRTVQQVTIGSAHQHRPIQQALSGTGTWLREGEQGERHE